MDRDPSGRRQTGQAHGDSVRRAIHHNLVEPSVSFYLFLVVVLSLSCGSTATYAEPSWRSAAASFGLVTGWSLLCHVAAFSLARQVLRDQMPWTQANRWLQVQLDVLRWMGLPVVLLCLAGFGLGPFLLELPWIRHSLVLQSIGLLMPGVIILMSTWSAEHLFGSMVGLTRAGWPNWLGSMLRAFRSGPAWLLGPTMLCMSAGDCLAFSMHRGWLELPTLRAWGIRSETLWIAGGVAAFAALWVFPKLVTRMIQTEPIEAERQGMILAWLSNCRVSSHRFLGTVPVRWDTGQRTRNALLAGILPWGRRLILSDRVLDELPREQLMMVVMHELAHAKRFHVPIRMVAIAPAWFLSANLGQWLVAESFLPASWGPMAGGVLGLISTVVTLGVIAYATELDADRYACRLARRAISESEEVAIAGHLDADQRDQAIMRFASQAMGDALINVTAGHPAARRASWLHPSLSMRLRWLEFTSSETSRQSVAYSG